MNQYRIKVEKAKDGTLKYAPQVRVISKRFQWFYSWGRIDNWSIPSKYSTCLEAQNGINQYKKMLVDEDNSKIIETKYINDNECNR